MKWGEVVVAVDMIRAFASLVVARRDRRATLQLHFAKLEEWHQGLG